MSFLSAKWKQISHCAWRDRWWHFWDHLLDEHLTNIFKNSEKTFLTWVKIVFGYEFMRTRFQYKTNVDIGSLFLAWCLKLASKYVAMWIFTKCVYEKWCGGLESFLGMSRHGKGFVCPGGKWLEVSEFTPTLWPYFLWSVNNNKEVRRATTRISMDGVKAFLKSLEVQAI